LDRESCLLTKVHHKHCVQLYDIYDTKHHVYIVMELCSGGELFDLICERNFSEKEAATIVIQITEALMHLHEQGIVHSDLKPENLLYASEERKVIKLLDYGLGKLLEEEDEVLKCRCSPCHYDAPEVLGRKSYSSASDYWSLGVVLYGLLCGYLPFYHEERAITVRLIRLGKFDFDDEEWEDISDEAKDLIQRLLQVDVDKRITGPEILQHPFMLKDLLDFNQLLFELFLSKVCPDINVNELQGWISNDSCIHPKYSPNCAENYATLLARCFVDECRPTLQEFQAIRLIEDRFQQNLAVTNE